MTRFREAAAHVFKTPKDAVLDAERREKKKP